MPLRVAFVEFRNSGRIANNKRVGLLKHRHRRPFQRLHIRKFVTSLVGVVANRPKTNLRQTHRRILRVQDIAPVREASIPSDGQIFEGADYVGDILEVGSPHLLSILYCRADFVDVQFRTNIR